MVSESILKVVVSVNSGVEGEIVVVSVVVVGVVVSVVVVGVVDSVVVVGVVDSVVVLSVVVVVENSSVVTVNGSTSVTLFPSVVPNLGGSKYSGHFLQTLQP